MEIYLQSLETEEYNSSATNQDIDSPAFESDLEKIFSSLQDLDTQVIFATAKFPTTNATTIWANLAVDERQMDALFLYLVRVSESYGLKFPREFGLLIKKFLYLDRYTRFLAPNMNMLRGQRVTIVSNQRGRNIYQ